VRLRPKFSLAQDLLGTFYLQQGKFNIAIQLFDSVIEVEPNNESALYHLIVASRKSGKTKAIPDLMKRLVQAKAFNRKRDEQLNRYTFVEPNRNQ
jgi:lipoprotein NlpI